jgi:hypothetical protein
MRAERLIRARFAADSPEIQAHLASHSQAIDDSVRRREHAIACMERPMMKGGARLRHVPFTSR